MKYSVRVNCINFFYQKVFSFPLSSLSLFFSFPPLPHLLLISFWIFYLRTTQLPTQLSKLDGIDKILQDVLMCAQHSDQFCLSFRGGNINSHPLPMNITMADLTVFWSVITNLKQIFFFLYFWSETDSAGQI